MSERPPYVGSPVERVEDLRLLRGKGTFVEDVRCADALHAFVVRSNVAHGVLRGVDTRAARAMPGVVAVLTAADLGRPVPRLPLRLWSMPPLLAYEQPVMAEDKVRYVGEPVAMVIADTAAIAEDAAEHVVVEIDPLPAVVDARSGIDGIHLFENTPGNSTITYRAGYAGSAAPTGDVYRRRERIRTNRHTAVPLELRGMLAQWSDGRLTVTGAAKVPFSNRAILSKLIGLSVEAIDMIQVDVGGGFGVRGDIHPEDFLVPFAARLLGRPVRWCEDFRQHLMAANHARQFDGDVEIVCSRDGQVLALQGHIFADIGAYLRATGNVGPRNIAQFMCGPYRIQHVEIDVLLVVTNKTPTGSYRGPGRYEADFFRERLFDLAANDLGIDRVEFRRRNLVSEDAMPFRLPDINPMNREETLDSGNYLDSLQQCLDQFGWDDKVRGQGLQDDGRWWGVGLACFIEAGASGPRETARIEVDGDGGIAVVVGGALVGQGIETVMSQIAADALGVSIEGIQVFHGSTTLLHEGGGASHSRGTVMCGSAILAAAENFKAAVRKAAALRLNCAEDEVQLGDRVAFGPGDARVGWGELAAPRLAAEGTFTYVAHTFAYGTQAVQVAVDVTTGHIEVVDCVCTEDVGRVINPLTMTGQMIGSMVQGLGGVFLEELAYDSDGQLLVGSHADYLMPLATDFPALRAYPTGDYPSPTNPLGAKGAGEGAVIGTAGAVANAVAAALADFGVTCCTLPLSPSRVWAMVQEGKVRGA